MGQGEARNGRPLSLLGLIREDFRTHRRAWTSPGFHAMVMYRLGAWRRRRSWPLRVGLAPFTKLMHLWVRNFYGIEIYDTCTIGRRFRIGHQNGIVIHKFATFGNDCRVHQGVTFGVGTTWRRGHGPRIGNRVNIGVGAVIVGEPVIGDDVNIGPNVVISSNIPAGCTVFAPPPRIIRQQPLESASNESDRVGGERDLVPAPQPGGASDNE